MRRRSRTDATHDGCTPSLSPLRWRCGQGFRAYSATLPPLIETQDRTAIRAQPIADSGARRRPAPDIFREFSIEVLKWAKSLLLLAETSRLTAVSRSRPAPAQ